MLPIVSLHGGLTLTNQWTNGDILISHHLLQNPSNFWIVAFNASAAVSASLLSASLPSCSAVYSDRARFNWEFRSAMSSLALVWMDCPSCTADACSSCSVSICLWKSSALLRASFHSLRVHLSLLPLHLATFESLHSTPANKASWRTPSWCSHRMS